jgi:DNA-binding transcriptional regulator YiaG
MAKRRRPAWGKDDVRSLRTHLGMTQQELADEMGTRQQTISEWETGMYQPRGASVTLLNLVAERAGFRYGETAAPDDTANDRD